ncbi:MAG: sulfite exporter TauE/SafE family protein [Pseudorhodoplanes sp.]|nr:MAG: sulfite exporter TauE/SafE family protein [Pseudorhodoplanes sp.]
MIDNPDFSNTVIQLVAEPRFIAAVAIAVISGVVRGFSGFGSALIYIPLMAAVYEPRAAAVTFVLIDVATSVSFMLDIRRHAVWREVLPLAAAAMLAAQFGTLILQYADPVALRWAISALVSVIVAILISGWRYHGRPHIAVTVAVGLFAGVLGGAVQISGPPIIIYWLGSMQDIAVVRANLISYFGLFSAGSVITYAAHGLITVKLLALSVLLGPLHVLSMWGGSKIFTHASSTSYRRVAFVIIGASAIVAMPLWDKFVR